MLAGFPVGETRLPTHVVRDKKLYRDGCTAPVFLVSAASAGRLRNEASREERVCRYVLWFLRRFSGAGFSF